MRSKKEKKKKNEKKAQAIILYFVVTVLLLACLLADCSFFFLSFISLSNAVLFADEYIVHRAYAVRFFTTKFTTLLAPNIPSVCVCAFFVRSSNACTPRPPLGRVFTLCIEDVIVGAFS